MKYTKFDNLKVVWSSGSEITYADMYKYHHLNKAWVFQSKVSVPVPIKSPAIFANLFKNGG